jgi:hypothetical protein
MIYKIYLFSCFGEDSVSLFYSLGKFQIIMVRFGEYHNIRFFILNLQIMWVVIV